jgi:hypothetical protein
LQPLSVAGIFCFNHSFSELPQLLRGQQNQFCSVILAAGIFAKLPTAVYIRNGRESILGGCFSLTPSFRWVRAIRGNILTVFNGLSRFHSERWNSAGSVEKTVGNGS